MPRGIELLAELGIGRPIRVLEVLVAVEVIEIAPEFIEPMPVRQVLFEIAQVVLAELRRGVATRLQDFGKRDVFLLQSGRRARRADGRQARADRKLARDERCAPGRAAWLRIKGGEPQTFPRQCDRCWASGTPMMSPP